MITIISTPYLRYNNKVGDNINSQSRCPDSRFRGFDVYRRRTFLTFFCQTGDEVKPLSTNEVKPLSEDELTYTTHFQTSNGPP